MVSVLRTRIPALLLALAAVAADAAVVAGVDRQRVERNESFTLELTVDSTANLTPDLSVLEQDFIVGQTSRLSNTSIVNGEINRSMTWSISLMPRRAGQLTIPSVTIGTEQSEPITITVTEPSYDPPGEADVFITAEVDYDESFVQAQVIYTIKIYRAVATRQPSLREPTFSGAEVLVELAGDERSYEAVLNGRAYNVVERAFAVFPQQSGEVQISPARFEARVLKDGRITGRKVFESEPATITVNPIPAPPADYPDAAWLPAREVTLSDSWSRDVSELKTGEPISRHVTVSALGQLETQIPVIEPPTAAGVNIYPDRPSLNRRIESAGIRGTRTDQYALIAVEAGDVTLPPLELPWWDVEAAEWRIARLPERSLTILPSEEVVQDPGPAPDTAAADDEAPAERAQTAGAESIWKPIAEGLAIAWLLTVVAWWWSTRTRRDARPPAPEPPHRQLSRALREARRAAGDDDPRDTRRALMDWARLQWPDDPPRSLGAIAERVSAPLADELRALSATSYGANASQWDGSALLAALRSFSVSDAGTAASQHDPLPPLMPNVRA